MTAAKIGSRTGLPTIIKKPNRTTSSAALTKTPSVGGLAIMLWTLHVHIEKPRAMYFRKGVGHIPEPPDLRRGRPQILLRPFTRHQCSEDVGPRHSCRGRRLAVRLSATFSQMCRQ